MKPACGSRWLIAAVCLAVGAAAGCVIWLTSGDDASAPTESAYCWGAFHVHSTYSDGLGTLPEIAAAARDRGLSFVILGDHGSPNPAAGALDRIVGGVRFYGGSETSHPDGHLLVAGLNRIPRYVLPPSPPDAIADVQTLGGFTVLLYPEWAKYRWRYWEDDFRPQGIEVLNLFSALREAGVIQQIDVVMTAPFGDFHILKALRRPQAEIRRWDELLARGMTFGFYGLDFHGGFRSILELPVRVPSYRMGFGLLALGIRRTDAGNPLAAVRRGDFFSVIRAAAEPDRFEFCARQDGLTITPGRTVSGRTDLEIEVAVSGYVTRIVLFRDGESFRQTDAGRLELADAPDGMYRVEVYLRDHPSLAMGVPWICSNPIGIGDRWTNPAVDETAPPAARSSIDWKRFRVETDAVSHATFTTAGSDGEFAYTLIRPDNPGNPRWCALALREPLDLSGGRGVYIDARSDPEMRYNLELRSGDRWYYASFRAGPDGEGRSVCIPFRRFYRVGGGREPLPLDAIDGLFVTISSQNAMAGFSGRLHVREIGWYR
ncbi:MAG TPA: hypothetical protein PLU41_02185 [Acidobacteriota bacterium]|nr:hypothetical protein [Acidobacteriota bacterium]HQO24121.1 hypothetical protein [Acidobacteriota bacterium]HQP72809.1 hypothetical protein [Acidobacteriota bacterium]